MTIDWLEKLQHSLGFRHSREQIILDLNRKMTFITFSENPLHSPCLLVHLHSIINSIALHCYGIVSNKRVPGTYYALWRCHDQRNRRITDAPEVGHAEVALFDRTQVRRDSAAQPTFRLSKSRKFTQKPSI